MWGGGSRVLRAVRVARVEARPLSTHCRNRVDLCAAAAWLRMAPLGSSWPGLSPQVGFTRLAAIMMRNSGKPELRCHPRLHSPRDKTWMPGTRPGMTGWRNYGIRGRWPAPTALGRCMRRESQSVQRSADNLGHSALVVPPVWRLPGMVEAGILRKRDAHGSRRCFAPTARAKGAARTLICYPLSASPRSMQKAAG
jgi:hypothetical protein